MKLADDPAGALNLEVLAQRAARLAKVAEAAAPTGALRYVIGSEVPVPGGAMEHEEGVGLTQVHDAQMTIDIMCDAFLKAGLHSAWERVLALVVQPGVEFGDDFVLPYQPVAARELSRYIESQSVVFEAHSTDYQSRDALRNMVQDHFAILKVGPALTFAFREAVFALAHIEHELLPAEERSNLVDVVEAVMLAHPAYWKKYYRGNEQQITLQRKYSLSDRIRYYWNDSRVQAALDRLQQNLTEYPIPLSLLSQFLPQQYAKVRRAELPNDPQSLILDHIQQVLDEYAFACGSSQRQ